MSGQEPLPGGPYEADSLLKMIPHLITLARWFLIHLTCAMSKIYCSSFLLKMLGSGAKSCALQMSITLTLFHLLSEVVIS